MHIQVNGTSYMDRAVVGSMSVSGSVTMQVSAPMYVLHKVGVCYMKWVYKLHKVVVPVYLFICLLFIFRNSQKWVR